MEYGKERKSRILKKEYKTKRIQNKQTYTYYQLKGTYKKYYRLKI